MRHGGDMEYRLKAAGSMAGRECKTWSEYLGLGR